MVRINKLSRSSIRRTFWTDAVVGYEQVMSIAYSREFSTSAVYLLILSWRDGDIIAAQGIDFNSNKYIR
jgi:hypothetical protein